MHAIRQHEFGPPETLRYEEVSDLEPASDQVRIAVAASGVHLIDTMVRKGATGGPFPVPELPMTPGREVAGTVDVVGSDADASWLGRRVVAHLGQASGGYAEQAVVAASSLHEVPVHVSPEVAVAMIGTGRTTMGVLGEAALVEGDVVLLTAAAGGMGALLVQAARHTDATVIGAAGGPAKAVRVREFGADLAVDYSDPGWTDAVRSFLGDRSVTVLLDGVGGARGEEALSLVGVGGRVVIYGFASGAPIQITTEVLMGRGLQATWVVGPRMLQRAGGLRALEREALGAASDGRLVPLVQPFALKDAAAAHAALEARATTGKVVLLP